MFTLPQLPYQLSSLEPYIDKETMEIHYGKHHSSYVEKLNAVLERYPDLHDKTIEDLLTDTESLQEEIRQSVINFGGGHYNHTLFWEIMAPTGTSVPPRPGIFFDTIVKNFGSFEVFKNKFTEKAISVFGSGWVFLVKTSDGKLIIKRHSFQNTPIMHGGTPLLAVDVWEHAYYLKYQNRRDEYVKAWWNVVNWEKVESLFAASGK